MEYRKGERVRHPAQPDWGLGEILEGSNGGSVRVFFVGAGEKTLSLNHVEPVKVTGEAASHALLDNLTTDASGRAVRYKSLPHSVEWFLEQFPEGFYGNKFAEHERKYKDDAHARAIELLGREEFTTLLQSGQHEEITKRALRVVNATNLIFPNEKMALKDGLELPNAKDRFCSALFSMLHGNGASEPRFVAFCDVLENMHAAKWTIASYFPFFMDPSQYMFVKPTVTQNAADICAYEIGYKSHLNWRTYELVLAFSKYLFSELSELKPRDMIDVQSFMWCIAPGTYGNG